MNTVKLLVLDLVVSRIIADSCGEKKSKIFTEIPTHLKLITLKLWGPVRNVSLYFFLALGGPFLKKYFRKKVMVKLRVMCRK